MNYVYIASKLHNYSYAVYTSTCLAIAAGLFKVAPVVLGL